MGGEHEAAVVGGLTDAGSSPHVRGARIAGWVGGFHRGIIPACAGSTRLYATHHAV